MHVHMHSNNSAQALLYTPKTVLKLFCIHLRQCAFSTLYIQDSAHSLLYTPKIVHVHMHSNDCAQPLQYTYERVCNIYCLYPRECSFSTVYSQYSAHALLYTPKTVLILDCSENRVPPPSFIEIVIFSFLMFCNIYVIFKQVGHRALG